MSSRSRSINPIRDQGFALLELLIAISVLVLILGAGLYVYFRQGNQGLTYFASNKQVKSCKTTDGIEFCTKVSSNSIKLTDDLRIEATLHNTTNKPFSTAAIYSSSCNDPTQIINDKEIIKIRTCTEDITSIGIEAGQTKTYNLVVNVADLKQGNNSISLVWNDHKLTTKPISISLAAKTSKDKDKEKECFSAESKLAYCEHIDATIEEGYFNQNSTCNDFEKYIKPIGLQVYKEYCQLGEYGILTVSVPKSEVDSWIAKLNKLPEVQNAGIAH